MIRTLIADDNDVFRQRMKGLMDEDPMISVVGEATDGEEAIRISDKLKPDLVLMDVRMPVMDGIQALKILKEKMPTIKVIVLTIFNLKEYKEAAIKNGADEFELKKTIYKKLIPTIHKVMGC